MLRSSLLLLVATALLRAPNDACATPVSGHPLAQVTPVANDPPAAASTDPIPQSAILLTSSAILLACVVILLKKSKT